MFQAIDLTQIELPKIIDEPEFEVIFQRKLNRFLSLYPQHTAPVESDPLYKEIELSSYDEMHLRHRINDAAKAVTLATATGSDLDNIFPLWVKRETIIEANPDAVPPVEAVYEDDESLRKRKQLALESYTSAGTVGSYTFFALSASPMVKDAGISQPVGGEVICSILSREGDGTASAELLEQVEKRINPDDEDIRRLNDNFTAQSADIVEYTIEATLTFFTGPDKAVVFANAQHAVEQYADNQHRIGRQITISGIHAALHQAGVQNVELTSPQADITISNLQAPYCTQVTINDGGVYE
jgi:phage-related baseplate assembly protein